MGPMLARCEQVVPYLALYFNLSAMLKSDDGESKAGDLTKLDVALPDVPLFMLHLHMYMVLAKVVERYAS